LAVDGLRAGAIWRAFVRRIGNYSFGWSHHARPDVMSGVTAAFIAVFVVDLSARYNGAPVKTKSLQKLLQAIGIIDRAALCAARTKKGSTGIGDGAAAAADLDDGLNPD
jgi:hypothetical protein